MFYFIVHHEHQLSDALFGDKYKVPHQLLSPAPMHYYENCNLPSSPNVP